MKKKTKINLVLPKGWEYSKTNGLVWVESSTTYIKPDIISDLNGKEILEEAWTQELSARIRHTKLGETSTIWLNLNSLYVVVRRKEEENTINSIYIEQVWVDANMKEYVFAIKGSPIAVVIEGGSTVKSLIDCLWGFANGSR